MLPMCPATFVTYVPVTQEFSNLRGRGGNTSFTIMRWSYLIKLNSFLSFLDAPYDHPKFLQF